MFENLRVKFREFVFDKKFSEVLSGSVWALISQIVATCLGMVTSIIIARIYGVKMVGIIAMVQAFLMFTSIVTVLGTNTSILRLIPEHVYKYSVTSSFKVYRKTQYFVGLLSLLVGGILFFASDLIATNFFSKTYLSFYFAISAGFVMFRSLMDLNTQAVRGLQLTKVFALMRVLPSAIVLLILIVLTLLDCGPNSPVYAHMSALGITAIVGACVMDYFFRQRMMPEDIVHSMPLIEILKISSPMLMTASMQFVIGQTGVILLGVFGTVSEVGCYAVAVKLATLTAFVLSAINSMAAPKFSELYHRGEMDELFYIAKKSTQLIFWTTVPILLVLLVFGKSLLGLMFGEEFIVAYSAMAILVLGQFVNSISGTTGYFMNMTGHQIVLRNVMLVAGIINILVSLILIPRYGIIGASCAGVISLALWNFYILYFIKSRYGKTICYVPFLID